MELPRQRPPWSSNFGCAQILQPYQAVPFPGGNVYQATWPPGSAENAVPRMPMYRGPPPSQAVYGGPVFVPAPPELEFGLHRNVPRIEAQVQRVLHNLKPEEARTPYSVLRSALAALGVPSLCALGLSIHEIPSLTKLAATEARVTMLMECYVAARNVTTLHDLEREVVSSEGAKTYLDLGLGPLQEHSVVKNYFPAVPKVFRITTADVLQCMSIYMKTKGIKDVDEIEFLKYLGEEKSQCPQHLGVLLRNVRVYAEAVSRAQQQEQEVITKYSKQARARACHAEDQKPSILHKVSQFLNKEEAGYGSTKIKGKPLPDGEQKKRPRLDLLGSVPAAPGLSSCPYPSAAEERHRLVKRTRQMSCTGHNTQGDGLCLDSTSSSRQQEKSVLKRAGPQPEALLETVLEDVTWFFNGKRLKKISKVFGAEAQTFLWAICVGECLTRLKERTPVESSRKFTPEWYCNFLKQHWHLLPRQVTQAFKCQTESNMAVSEKVPRHRLSMFLKQALLAAEHEEGFLRNIGDQIKKQFKFNFSDLGFPSATELLSFAKAELERGTSESFLVFSGALTPMVQAVPLLEEGTDASNGPITALAALQCLEGAPLLSDLATWSQWELVYAPSLGNLLDFLEGEYGQGKLQVLITLAGEVLRINKSATVDDFLASITKGSAKEMAECLVSLFAIYGGVFHIPMGLLQRYAAKGVSLLLEAKGSFETGPLTGIDNSQGLAAVSCILECLNSLPPELQVLGAKILLPAIEGGESGKEGHYALLQACGTYESRSVLHRVGLQLGIQEWVHGFHGQAAALIATNVPTHLVGRGDPEKDLPLCTVLEGELPSQPQQSVIPLWIGVSGASTLVTEASGEVQSTKETAHCEAVIAAIRQEEFGLADELEASQKSIFVKQNARMGRALNRLSRDLYSEDSHFVLELIQNADDNHYESGVQPTLMFIVGNSYIHVLNNEVGFTEANIRALCDVGKSTKEGRTEYIGHKGIGFKSVFKVTDAPEIHSNGFHIKFDISTGNIGYILPSWVEPISLSFHISLPASVSNEAMMLSNYSWKTCIRLPLKDSLQGNGAQQLASKFDINCSTLLFLKKLQCIVVENHVTGSKYTMKKESIGQNIVTVVHSHGSSMNWLVAGEQLSAAIRSPGVEATELVLAFPLQKGSSGDYNAVCSKQKVFSFLPLREYGLTFLLQGDFTLTSSREDVDRDSAWNAWLLSNVPDLFIKAAGLYKKLVDNKTQGQAMTEFLRFVPSEGEVLGFFSPLPRLILARLRAASFLPVERGTECSIPCFLLRGWDTSVQTVISAAMLRKHLGLQYLDKDVQISDSLAASLGVQVYGKETLFALMASISQHTGGLDLLGLPWLRSWFVLLYDCLLHAPQCPSMQDWKGLSGVECVPLSDGTYATIGEGNLWFAGRDEGNEMFRHFPILLAELRVVHPSLLGAAEDRCETDKEADKVKRLFSMLGIQQVSSHHVIKTHVLTAMRDSGCVRKNPALVVEYLSFVMVHLMSNCQLCKADDSEIKTLLMEHAVILTNNGLKRIGSEPIHFSQIMGNPIPVQSFLENTGVLWNEVDSSYLEFAQKSSRVMSVMQLRTFFKQLGITDFLEIRRVNAGDDSNSADWHCPELVAILDVLCQCGGGRKKKVVSQGQKQLTALLTEIDKQWNESFGAFQGQLMSADGGPSSETTFVKQLRRYRCMRSSLTGNLQLPTLLFDRCKAVEDVLGARAPYALPQLSSRGLKEVLGLRTEVALEDALNLLEQWQLSSPHLACPSQMERFYSLLWQSKGIEKERVIGAMIARASIFLPQAVPGDPDQVVEGKFFLPQDTVWDDTTGAVEALHKAHSARDCIFPKLTLPLKRVFPTLFGFFVEELQVLREPTFDTHLDILLHIANSCSPYEMQRQVFGIFKSLSLLLESGGAKDSTVQHWRSCFQDLKNRVFPTVQGSWISLHESEGFICVSDNALLRQDMSTCTKKIQFLLLDDGTTGGGGLDQDDSAVRTTILPLLRALNIPLLSESVGLEIKAQGQSDGRRLLCIISWSLQYIQRYLAKHWPQEYQDLQNGDVMGRIKTLRCEVVTKLVYRHILPLLEWSSPPKNSQCLLQFQERKLYVEAAHAQDYSTVYKELSRFFLGSRADMQLANFLHLVTLKRQSGASDMELETFVAAVQGIPPLSSGVNVWSIPEDSYTGVSMLSCMPRLSSGPEVGELLFPCKVKARDDTGDAEEYVLQNDGRVAQNDRKLRRHQAPNEQQQEQTGRAGEAYVYQHLVKKCGATKVRWVNEAAETGAAFDIVVELPDGSKEFVEVKATRSNDKDWFEISAREWEFAHQQGEKYTIIRVQLGQRIRLLRLPNPVKLCHNKGLQLVLMLQDTVVSGDSIH